MLPIEEKMQKAVRKPLIQNVSRRSFLKTTALAAGSTFVLGIYAGCSRKEKYLPELRIPAQGTMDNATFKPGLLIGINDAGDVFIVCTRSEMGQGIRTGMPPVIADELEANWSRVHVVQADGDSKYGDQNTDGSRSVRWHFDDWRAAGAAARAMLVSAAAKTWEVPESECTAKDHVVTHTPTGRELGYGALAAKAATLEVPENPKLKSRDEWRYIAKPVRGVDNLNIVTGRAAFGIDMKLPGMLYASVERCPVVVGAKLKSYDDKAALAVPGVRKVVKLKDGTQPPNFNPLGGVAIVADNTWAAFEGRKALKMQWDPGANAKHNSASYRVALEKAVSIPGKEVRSEGDVDAAMKDAAKTMEAIYHVPMMAHAPMEPPAALAWTKDDGTCEIWAPTQDPQSAQRTVAGLLGVAPEKVTVHVTLLGGGFGRKSKPDFIAEAALISKEAGAPIKITWKREDEIQFDYFHAPSVQYLKAGFDEQGKTIAWLHRTAFPSIMSTFQPGVKRPVDFEVGMGCSNVPYNIPNLKIESGEAEPHVRIGWMRSVCNIQHSFAVNAFAGEMAHAAGRDQREYLLELIGPPRNLTSLFGDPNSRDEKRHPFETHRLTNVVKLATEQAGWGKQLPAGHALGVAVHYSFFSYVAHVVHASVENGQVNVHRVDCAVDCGTYVNPDRVKAQMEGAVVFGLTIALHGKVTAKNGAIEQSNFHDYPLLRIAESPEIHVHLVESDAPPAGVGEPGVPPLAPALANALLAITGKPVRELPIDLSMQS